MNIILSIRQVKYLHMSEVKTLDVMVGSEKQGIAYDVNPVYIQTDEQCKEALEKLKRDLTLTSNESTLLDCCISVVSASDGDDVSFGPSEILDLAHLADINPKWAPEILACLEHLSASVLCEGSLPSEIYIMAAGAHADLGEIRELKSLEDLNMSESDDEVTEEELTDDEP